MNEDRIKLVGEVIREASMTEEERELMTHRITPETPLPPMQPLFKMFDVPCFYRGELVADCGKAKSGKTFFLSIIMACCLKQQVLALERIGEKPLKVLWVDTEQSQQSTQDIIVNRIMPLTGVSTISDDQFYAFNVRGIGFEKRRKLTELAIRSLHPDLVIIDGIKDLVTDINDAYQATEIMEQLMALAQEGDCCIVNVLHQNKSEADRNMRGSIGTELTNKAFEVYECEYWERYRMFKVTQTLSRRQRMSSKLYYELTEEGLPKACHAPQEQPRDDNGRWISAEQQKERLVKLFTEAMEGRKQRKFAEVMGVAMSKLGVADKESYYALLKEAEQLGIVRSQKIKDTKNPDIKVTWIEIADEQSLPF